MGTPAKKAKKVYVTWNNEDRKLLVEKRIQLDVLFTGKNANSNDGWRKVAEELHEKLGHGKDFVSCKNQWNSLIKKYKSFFVYKTGEGTGEEATKDDPNDWPFYETHYF